MQATFECFAFPVRLLPYRRDTFLQRLFSNFACGWPGRGLLLERLLAGAALLHCGITYFRTEPQVAAVAPHIIGAAAGILLLVGLWTPVAGCLVAIAELWI